MADNHFRWVALAVFLFFFYRFRPIKLIGSLLQSAAGLKEFVGKLSCRHRPQHARFLTCLCKTNVRRQFVLKLFCYPQKLVYDVSQQISRIKMRYIAEGSSVEPVCEEEEILVSFSKAIILQGEDDGTAIFVRYNIINLFLAHQVHRI